MWGEQLLTLRKLAGFVSGQSEQGNGVVWRCVALFEVTVNASWEQNDLYGEEMWTYLGPSEVELTYCRQDGVDEPNINMNVQDKIVIVTGG